MTPVTGSPDVENAWTKARVYLFGGHNVFFEKQQITQNNIHILGRLYRYNSLVDFYLTGNCIYDGYIDLAGNHGNEYGGPIQLNMEQPTRSKYAYMILGRISHLLADVGVPAHAHDDEHNCGFPNWDRDEYELKNGK